jgi:hypothetical protein
MILQEDFEVLFQKYVCFPSGKVGKQHFHIRKRYLLEIKVLLPSTKKELSLTEV